ncbi:MAG: hypothetical protein JW797_16915 [Bradymonadales bacterium]|nr:hypothetical protein [Bradymonadales bacterium]
MQLSLNEVFKILETVADRDALRGMVGRYADQLATDEGVNALIERLDTRRRALNRWNGMHALVDNLRWQKQADMRHDLETATQSVLRAENVAELAVVAKNYPIVFSSSMLISLKMLQEESAKMGDSYTASLATNRLRNLQMIHLATAQGMELNRDNLRILVTRILEAESLRDLLELIEANPVVLAEAFDVIFTEMGQEGARLGKHNVPKVAKLRLDVLNGIRRIVEAVVKKQEAEGDIDAAVAELNTAAQADHFLDVVARYPFILGEDFQTILQNEMEKARDAGEEKAASGIFKRMGHLTVIGNIVVNLNKTRELAQTRMSQRAPASVEQTTGLESQPQTPPGASAEGDLAAEGEPQETPSTSNTISEAEDDDLTAD